MIGPRIADGGTQIFQGTIPENRFLLHEGLTRVSAGLATGLPVHGPIDAMHVSLCLVQDRAATPSHFVVPEAHFSSIRSSGAVPTPLRHSRNVTLRGVSL